MLKEFPPLYAKNKNGAWKEWKICVRMETDVPRIHIQHGLFQGKLITDTLIVSETKRGHASLWDQAVLMAQSKWDHKHDREYHHTSMEEKTPPPNKPLPPMLAKTFEHGKHLQFPLYIQPKIDGLRCLAHAHGLFSRTGCPFLGLDSIRNDLLTYFKDHEGCVVDGELYSDEMPFEELSGYCRRQKEIPSGKDVVFHVFDVITPTDLAFEERLRFFPTQTRNIRLVPTQQIERTDQIEEYLHRFVEQGYEGIILRNKKGTYRQGHRSWDLQKYKLFQEEEFQITGFAEGTGREKGLVVWECQTPEGKTFHVRPRGGYDARRDMFEHAEKYIGKPLTIVFQEYTKDRVPRFPVAKAIRSHY